jgi:hypothetical protein
MFASMFIKVNERYFYGVRMRMVINQTGVATGWVLVRIPIIRPS